ncbi:MAG: hypothetical protein HY248_02130 [Fimbriimonas ginsengisoli]|nr:hypothetical protein [Fimbriimonas ginsengisoli]
MTPFRGSRAASLLYTPAIEPGEPLQTKPFCLARAEVSLLTAEQYALTFGPVLIGVPAAGVAMLVLGDAFMKAIGLVCVLWPLTIPGRAFLITSRAARALRAPTVASVEDGALLLKPDHGAGLRLPLGAIWRLKRRRGYLIVWTRRLALVFLPESAFKSPDAVERFAAALKPG